jgi:hypothetical protein
MRIILISAICIVTHFLICWAADNANQLTNNTNNAADAIAPGTVITMANWQNYKAFMPDGMAAYSKAGISGRCRPMCAWKSDRPSSIHCQRIILMRRTNMRRESAWWNFHTEACRSRTTVGESLPQPFRTTQGMEDPGKRLVSLHSASDCRYLWVCVRYR